MNFSPEMLNSFKNMINPQMVRQMGNKVNGMSDDQLKSFLVSMGKLLFVKILKLNRNGSYFPASLSRHDGKYEKYVRQRYR